MKNNISVQILRFFSKNDLKDFELFLESPYHNSNKKITALNKIVFSSLKSGKDEILEREKIYKKIFGEKEFNNQILKNLFSEYQKLLKNFLAIKSLERNTPKQNLFFIKELYEKKSFHIAERFINEELSRMDDMQQQSETYFEDKLELLDSLDLIYQMDVAISKRGDFFATRNNYMILNFFVKFFEDLNDSLLLIENKKNSEETNPQLNFLKYINLEGYINFMKEKYPQVGNLISIYYTMYLTRVDKENEEHFYRLKELVLANVEPLNIYRKYNFWIFLQNAVYSNYGLKNKKFNRELFEINKFFLRYNFWEEIFKGYMPGLMFINIVTNANISEEYDWAEKFINEFGKYLEPETRENDLNIARVMILFSQKKFTEALVANSLIKTDSIGEKINLRFYNVMIFSELGDYDSAINELENFRKFINSMKESGKLPVYAEEMTLKSVKHFSRIANAMAGNKKLDYAYYKEAKNDKSFRFKKWVMEKMEERV
ncbi:MAG TPA: hypothetical protein DIS94_01145 [Bacteroidetes bacterium]|nr:hypothetical protein [Bacteroidota bacterium]